jgi:hypothetical protein
MSQNEPTVQLLDPADQNLIEWFDHLETLRACCARINRDTPQNVPEFFKADPGTLLPDDMQKQECGICFQDTTGIAVPTAAFAEASFRDVLGSIIGLVSDRVQDVFEAVGRELGTAPATPTEEWPTHIVYKPGQGEDLLCRRLADAMRGVFPKNTMQQTAIRNLLRREGVIVRTAVGEIVRV